MIITKLIGGLGNQMFQYAAGRRAAVANKAELKLDITGYDHQVGITKREYKLYVFHIEDQFATRNEIAVLKQPRPFLSRSFPHRASYLKEKHFHFDPDILAIPDNTYLEGYWVSEKYFLDMGDIIRKKFTLKNKRDKTNSELTRHIKKCNSVSIHVRRSDYVRDKKTRDFHGLCGLSYYKKAVSLITKQVKDSTFFIFSDDPRWCKANFRFSNPTTYVTHNLGKNDCEDMRLMSVCKHNIIANSSFSWWSAWLNINPNKVVIAPKKWFTDKSINTKDLMPRAWTKI